MKKIKKIGRPPAKWMFEIHKTEFLSTWTDAYEIARILSLNVRTVKSFLAKLKVKPKHVIEGGTARARYKVSEIRKGAKEYVEPWV